MAAVLVVAGCGGRSGASGPTVDYTSAASIAGVLDRGGFACTDFKLSPDVVSVKEEGSCKHGPVMVTVATFNTTDEQAAAQAMGRAFAEGLDVDASAFLEVRGEKWTVWLDDRNREQAEQVQKILGGKVQ